MSRGPGRWQRAILAALDEYAHVPVIDLVYAEVARPDRKHMVAARRAAKRLAQDGHVRAIYARQCGECHATVLDPLARCCGRLGYVLAVTRDPETRTMRPLNCPRWISVAPASDGPRATHTDGKTV